MPLVPATRTDPIVSMQLSVIALVIVTAPNPPGSRQSISPAANVFEIAPAKVLQGAVRLHGLASSPTPDTQVRVAWAFAGTTQSRVVATTSEIVPSIDVLAKAVSPQPGWRRDATQEAGARRRPLQA